MKPFIELGKSSSYSLPYAKDYSVYLLRIFSKIDNVPSQFWIQLRLSIEVRDCGTQRDKSSSLSASCRPTYRGNSSLNESINDELNVR
jgi:hypothetical protein